MLSQINWQTLTKLLVDRNPVVVVTMKNLSKHYSMDTYAVDRQNGKNI